MKFTCSTSSTKTMRYLPLAIDFSHSIPSSRKLGISKRWKIVEGNNEKGLEDVQTVAQICNCSYLTDRH
jgi:hypothetical protein